MKSLILSLLVLSAVACTSAQQQKAEYALDVAKCKIGVLLPYADYFTSEQFSDALQGKDYFSILNAAGVTPDEIKATGAALKACHEEKQ